MRFGPLPAPVRDGDSRGDSSATAQPEGRVIENPISGERIVVRRSAAETDGRLFEFDLFLPPGAHVPAGHAHPLQEERFTVVTGRFRFRLGRRTILAGPGDAVVVPRGTAHWFGNAGPGVAQARVEARPALRTEELFVATEALSRSGRIPGTRLPPLPDLAAVLREFDREVATPYLPRLVARSLLAPLAWLGRRRIRRRGRLDGPRPGGVT